MVRASVGACAGLLIASGGAFASTLEYTSAPLTPGTFGNGATQVIVAYTVPRPPLPGKCVLTYKLKSYDDGARTLHDLKAGYVVVKKFVKELPNGEETIIPATYADVCLGADGVSVTGTYQIYATRTAGLVYEQFIANNQQAGADVVEFDLYLGGDVPQVYEDSSTQPGTWRITP